MTLEQDISGQFRYYMFRYGPIFRNLVLRGTGNASVEYAESISEEMSYVLAEARVLTENRKKENRKEDFLFGLETLVKSYYENSDSAYEPRFHTSYNNDGFYQRIFDKGIKRLETYEKKKFNQNNKEEFFNTFAESFIDFVRTSYRRNKETSFSETADTFFSLLHDYLTQKDSSYIESFRDTTSENHYNSLYHSRYDFDDFIGDDALSEELKQLCNALLLYSPEANANPLLLPNSLIFSGPPGTGKTMMARIMMDYLRKNSSKLNLKFTPCIVDPTIKNKWYGESEKRLKADFAKVKDPAGIGILVFDEADAILNPNTNGSLESSLQGLLLAELEGLSSNERGNYFSIFITNKPYSGLEEALHSRSREFYFKQFDDADSYSKLIDQTINKSLQGLAQYQEENQKDYSKLAQFCLENQLSGRDVKKAVQGFLNRRLLLDVPFDILGKNFEEKRKFFQDRIKGISQDEMMGYFNSFLDEKTRYEKEEQENTILDMTQRKTWEFLSEQLARENLSNLYDKNGKYET